MNIIMNIFTIIMCLIPAFFMISMIWLIVEDIYMKITNIPELALWHKWYAWYPVKIETEWVWRKEIARCYIFVGSFEHGSASLLFSNNLNLIGTYDRRLGGNRVVTLRSKEDYNDIMFNDKSVDYVKTKHDIEDSKSNNIVHIR